MGNEKIFEGKIRAVTDEDKKNLPRLSYSGMELFKNCNLQYHLKYNEGKRANETTLALELGSILHRVLEEKIKNVINNNPVNYNDLFFMLNYGVKDTDGKTREELNGIDVLKKKYFEEWWEKDNASGMTYPQKIKIFEKVLKEEMEDQTIWHPAYTELPFEFVYKDRVIFIGFIDRVDRDNDGKYRVVDYKSSKKIYDQKKLATSLQFGTYALAIYQMFGELPVEFQYRFILLDETQEAMTKGWEKRLEKALDGVLDKMEKNKETGVWIPSASPLCWYCPYNRNNPKNINYKEECEYYSLWSPFEKRWDVNKKWNALDRSNNKLDNKAEDNKPKRKLIF